MKPYTITTDLQRIMVGYKMAKGVVHDDRKWDKENWDRYIRSAKKLLAFFGDWEDAVFAINRFGQQCYLAGITGWGLDAVARNAKKLKGEMDADNNVKAYDGKGHGKRRYGSLSPIGEGIGEVIHSL